VPGYEMGGCPGSRAPRNTPAEIVEKLNRENLDATYAILVLIDVREIVDL
jgi:hypothetical protein